MCIRDRVVLDYGTATPTINPALRRAILLRDRHCQFAGCDIPARWCDIHHIQPVAQGGPTNERNLACVCRKHHGLIHDTGWQLTRKPSGTLHTRSP